MPSCPSAFGSGRHFRFQDDILNLDAEERLYGKEIGGDIAEGKRTFDRNSRAASRRGAHPRPFGCDLCQAQGGQDGGGNRVGADDHAPAGLDRLRQGHFAAARTQPKQLFERRFDWLPRSPHRAFLEEMFQYMIERKL
jgi:hypothetical protein